ncbi:polysaccharide biosynthesis C-terminal domain-containing protein [Neobacillus novalis]|uniref:Polysaccharide biosynthesis C-terminal domain-containing protein n=1 Tax=Neobacillus novalis TaxID=220687 RepID=A0AA95S8N8_9BACI|nr:oligosaccharide flippase family protein [Neobacillus novalis]WHY86070.1 polysaccharide biosynthesis C-terminal domain-containing protein [Neobacillus novalis]
MGKIKRFLSTSGTYFIGSVLSKIIAFLLLPLYTSKLSPEEFGMYDLVVTIISFFAPIAFFQIWDGMFRFSFDKHKSDEKYSVISNSFSVMVLGHIIYSLIFGIIYQVFNFEYAWLIFFYGILVALQYLYTFIARSFLRNNLFVISGLINSILNAIINIVLILKFNFGIESLYIAFILGSIIQVLIIEAKLHPLRNFHFDRLNIKIQLDMIKFSLPLCIAAVSYWMLSGYTKVVISQQLGNYANGLFAVANRFTSMIALVVTVFQYAWNEMAYLMVEDKNRIVIYKKGIEYIFKVVIIGSSIFLLLIKVIFPYFVDSAYHEALMIMPLSLIGVASNVFANFIGTIFMAEKITKWIFWTTLISSGINIVCLWIFTPVWGLHGAVGALCLSFIAIALLRILAVRKIFNIKLSLSNLFYILLLAVVTYIFFTVESIPLLFMIILILIGITVYSFSDILLAILRAIKMR